MPALVCEACGEEIVRAEHLALFELAAAKWIAEAGNASPEAFRFMRKALDMQTAEAAGLLVVTPEIISRWEDGSQPIDPRAFSMLGAAVLDRFEGKPR